MAARFRPRELRQDASPDELRRQLNDYFRDIAADLGAITARPRITEVQLGDYTARFGEIVRMAPPAAGARLILPAPNAAVPNGRVTLLLVGSAGAVTVEAVSSTVNGADTLALGAGEGLVEFTLAPDSDGWFAVSSDILIGAAPAKSVLANAGNASAVPAFLAGTGAFQYLRVNSANTGLEWAVLSLTSFPAQASDTFLGNVSGSSGVPSAVNLSSLAGTDLTFSAHALNVSSTWSSVLGRGATSGAHNPIVDASQYLGFGSNPAGVSSGQIRADGAFSINCNDTISISGITTVGIASTGDVNIFAGITGGDINLDVLGTGRVAVFGGYIDFTGKASSPAVSSGHGLHWTKTDSPSRPYFKDDAGTDNKLAYVSDIAGIANSQLANMGSDTVKGNVSGSTGAPSDVSLSSLAGTGLSFSGHQFSVTAAGSSIIATSRISEDFTAVGLTTTALGTTEIVVPCGQSNWVAVASALSATITSTAGTSGHPGQLKLTTTGSQLCRLYHNRPGWAAGSVANIILYDDIARIDWVIQPDAITSVDFLIGLVDAISPANGFYFNLDTNVDSNLHAVSIAGSSSASNSGTAVSTMSKYSMILTSGQIQFQVDGVNFGSAITTHLPTGVALTPYARIVARSGTPRSLTVDAFEYTSVALSR